ncbi:hypothetical protein [Bifidobacterium sp.]|uniref:hypothetical protein n=1 Tax=Bifidobacterium sp. TaxID=41200 RepID=UPI0039EC02A1
MTQKYIPTTTSVRLKFAGITLPELKRHIDGTFTEADYEFMFDRWLSAHDAHTHMRYHPGRDSHSQDRRLQMKGGEDADSHD